MKYPLFKTMNLILESLHRLPENSEYYEEEGCAVFAYALWLAHNKTGKLAVLRNPDGEEWNGEVEMTHVVYISPDGTMYDVRGGQMPDEIYGRYYVNNNFETFDPESFWNTYVGADDEKPLYGNLDDVNEALKIILQFPDLYNIGSKQSLMGFQKY